MRIKRIKRLAANQNGSVGLIMALGFLTIMAGILTLVLDTTKSQTGKTDIQNAVDAAALSTAEMIVRYKIRSIQSHPQTWRTIKPSDTEINNFAKQQYITNVSDQGIVSGVNATDIFQTVYDPRTQILTVSVSAKVSAPQLSTISGNSSEANVYAEASAKSNIGKPSNLEVAFSLDSTASMAEDSKMQKAVNAIKSLSNKYLSTEPDSSVFFSLIPFTTVISMYPFHVNLVAEATEEIESSIIDEIPVFTTENFSVNPKKGINGDEFQLLDRMLDGKGGRGNYYNLYSRMTYNKPFHSFIYVMKYLRKSWFNIQPLTNDSRVINYHINKLLEVYKDKDGDDYYIYQTGTAGVPGLFGAWLTIAKGWSGKWVGTSLAERRISGAPLDRSKLPSTDSKIKKVIIHLADGEENNVSGTAQTILDRSRNDHLYKELCGRIGQNNIKIYFILYGHSASRYSNACIAGNQPPIHSVIANASPAALERIIEDIIIESAEYDYSVRLIK